MRLTPRLLVLACALALPLAACGGGGDDDEAALDDLGSEELSQEELDQAIEDLNEATGRIALPAGCDLLTAEDVAGATGLRGLEATTDTSLGASTGCRYANEETGEVVVMGAIQDLSREQLVGNGGCEGSEEAVSGVGEEALLCNGFLAARQGSVWVLTAYEATTSDAELSEAQEQELLTSVASAGTGAIASL